MGDSSLTPGTSTGGLSAPGLDDPNLTQEERDLRLAMALQQEENAIAYDSHKKRTDAAAAAKQSRTSRSNCNTSLASIRKVQKNTDDAPIASSSDGAYYAPGSSDSALAAELQRVEETTAGTVKLMQQIHKDDTADKQANTARNTRSKNTI